MIKSILRRTLSPQAFKSLKSSWWQLRFRLNYIGWAGRFYLPHLVASRFVRPTTPKIQGFGNMDSVFLNQLRGINVFAPTRMCRIMTKHGSDKGNGSWHNYTTIYSSLFGRLRDQSLVIFELGLGTNNPELISSMGTYGRPGASLRGWRELFPRANIYGADIDRDILFADDRIKTYYCDQLDSTAIDDLWSEPDLHNGADIIIDDGLNTFEGNKSFLDVSLEHLRPGGFYVIEDIVNDAIGRWRDQLDAIYFEYPDYEFALVTLPNPFNHVDNTLMIVSRRR